MLSGVTAATIRREVRLPVRLPDGSRTPARLFSFDGLADRREHIALALGARAGDGANRGAGVPLVRLHSECLTGDVFGSERCDCGPQLQEAVVRICEVGGYLLYLRQEGRDIGLYNKVDAYALQEAGLDTYEANLALGFGEDERDYTVAAQMLLCLGVNRLDLLSNNPDKAAHLEAAGIQVDRRVPNRGARVVGQRPVPRREGNPRAAPAVSAKGRLSRTSRAHLTETVVSLPAGEPLRQK